MSFLRTRRFALGLATWMYIPLNFAKFTASNGVVLNMFNRLYIQIAQCNNFLIQTEGKDDEESLTQRAEVRFIRALDYYYLIDLYGNVLFVDENTGIGTYVPERITRANLYTYIEKELKEIEPQMKAPPCKCIWTCRSSRRMDATFPLISERRSIYRYPSMVYRR